MALKPLTKCAGGKSWLAPQLAPLLRRELEKREEGRYIEPFAGGAAVALALAWPNTTLIEYNRGLAALYGAVAYSPEFRLHAPDGAPTPSLETFLRVRDNYNVFEGLGTGSLRDRQARAYWYLNRTCFNGLHRENAKGEFNVPWNKNPHPITIPDLAPYHLLMQDWEMLHDDAVAYLTHEMNRTNNRTVVFADPPYDDGFTGYVSGGFSWLDQVQTAVALTRMADEGAAIVATNAATDRVLHLYADLGFNVQLVRAPRRISCDGNRADAYEMIAGANLNVREMTELAWVEPAREEVA